MAQCKNCKWISYSKTEDGDRFPWCPKFDDSPSVEDERDCIYYETMSQGDKIRNMTDEELAELLDQWDICRFIFGKCIHLFGEGITCKECMLEWLKSEVKE